MTKRSLRWVVWLPVSSFFATQAEGQSPSDSLAVVEAAVVFWLEEHGFSHPAGRIESACLEPPVHFFLPPNADSTPTLNALQAQAVSELLRTEAGLEPGHGCTVVHGHDDRRGWILDDAGRPAVSFLLSAPYFESPDAAQVHVGMLAGSLWGGGVICRWVRTPEAVAEWSFDACLRQWTS